MPFNLKRTSFTLLLLMNKFSFTQISSALFNDLHDIFILELVTLTTTLRVVLHTRAPDLGALHFRGECLMDPLTEVEYRAVLPWNDDWRFVVRDLALRLCVNSNEIQVVPNFLHELVKVPLILRADGHVMREFVQQVKLFNCDSVNLVENVDAGNVNAISLNNIDQVIHCVVRFEYDVAVGDSVLMQDSPDRVVRHSMRLVAMGSCDIDTATILPLKSDVWFRGVESDAEAFKFALDDALVSHGLLTVKHDQKQGACAADADDLFTTTFTVLGALNDTWQIEELDSGATIVVDARYTSQRGKLVIGCF